MPIIEIYSNVRLDGVVKIRKSIIHLFKEYSCLSAILCEDILVRVLRSEKCFDNDNLVYIKMSMFRSKEIERLSKELQKGVCDIVAETAAATTDKVDRILVFPIQFIADQFCFVKDMRSC